MNKLIGIALAAMTIAAAPAQALVLVSDSATFVAGDATQLGRLSRDGVPADWSADKPFPGELNVGTTYQYHTLAISFAANATQDVYYQISIDDNAAGTFTAAYDGSYNPAAKASNYLGDLGGSGNIFGNPAFFQVKVAAGGSLVLAVNNMTGGVAGPYPTYGYLVEAFSDTDYSENFPNQNPAVPEPATWAMMFGGFALAGGALRARRRASVRFA